MPLTTCNQKEFLIESKLNGFWGVLLLLLDLAVPLSSVVYSQGFVLVLLHLHLEFFIGEVK